MEKREPLKGCNCGSMKPVVCIIPCCKTKSSSGHIEGYGTHLTEADLPNTWNLLVSARNMMRVLAGEIKDVWVDCNSPLTSAVHLYTGAMYSQLDVDRISQKIQDGHLRLFVISAWYGIVDAFEPIHKYEAEMKGKIAKHWKKHELDKIISDLLMKLQPSRIYGFFAGNECWSESAAKYRYFFTSGLNEALKKGMNTSLSGCFYNESGRGAKAILGALGSTFKDFAEVDFDESFISDFADNGRTVGNVVIRFSNLVDKTKG